jgi:glycosyltransferase involved in cell wall biosynthesis
MHPALKMLIVTHDIPYPTVHGGRVDMWNRIIALHRFDVKIKLITWSDISVTQKQYEEIKKYVNEVIVLKRHRCPLFALHPKYPSNVISRFLLPGQYSKLLKHFLKDIPDIIFLDGLPGAIFATSLVKDLRLPFVFRSHNVEWQYIKQLSKVEKNTLKKLLLFLNIRRTFIIEQRVRQLADIVYDISDSDLNIWLNNGDMSKAKVLNPYFIFDELKYAGYLGTKEDIDVLYVGNMYMHNNIYGLKWFIENVVPMLSGLSIVFTGANPKPEILSLVNKISNLRVVANPEEVQSFYKRSSVLVNPIWHGSGVNIKMIEMLMTGKPVVSTTIGAKGLPEHLKSFVAIADKPSDFAKSIKECLKVELSNEQKEATLKEFNWINVKSLINEFWDLLGKKHHSV